MRSSLKHLAMINVHADADVFFPCVCAVSKVWKWGLLHIHGPDQDSEDEEFDSAEQCCMVKSSSIPLQFKARSHTPYMSVGQLEFDII